MSGPVTNEEILAYLVDLSANIANQFAEVEGLQTEYFITLRNILNLEVIPELNDLSANIAEQFRSLERGIIQEFAYTDSYILDLSANLTAQNKDIILMIAEETGQVLNSISNQTNDINTNTNTALSQYTNTINTNTNASVSTAVSILKH